MSVYTKVGSAGADGEPTTPPVSSSAPGSAVAPSSSTSAPAISSASGYATTSGTTGSSFYADLASEDGGEHRHMGCYIDARSGRMLRGDSTSSGNMTPARCSKFCSERGHDVFNLQFGTE